jgi:hypothetical protein
MQTNELANSIGGEDATTVRDVDGLAARILIFMSLSVLLAVSVSAFIAPWRVTTGLLLGGFLSILNYSWMRDSIGALLEEGGTGRKAGGKLWRYLIRYFVIGSVVFVAYELNVISLAATIVGLCSFVAALFAEALRQFYLSMIDRKEIS